MSILSHLGFGGTEQMKKARKIGRYKKELKDVLDEIRDLYKDGINSNAPAMKEFEELAKTAKESHDVDAALAALAGAKPLFKQTKAALKDQEKYAKEAAVAKEAVVRWAGVIDKAKSDTDKSRDEKDLESMQRCLKEADEAAERANYVEARKRLAQIRELDCEVVSDDREDYVRKRDRVRGGIGLLKALGFTAKDKEITQLEAMLKSAYDKATGSKANFKAAAQEFADADKILGSATVTQKRQAAVNDLKTGAFRTGDNEEDWANAVIGLYDLNPRFGKGDFHEIDIPIKIDPKDFLKYKKLQETIAAKGLEENERPTINLTVRGKNAGGASFGIIGGTGPLSDAEMLTKTMENLIAHNKDISLDDVHIRLLSAPPPRPTDKAKDQYLKKLTRAAKRLAAFSEEPHSSMALASNTAHSNIFVAGAVRRAGRTIAGRPLDPLDPTTNYKKAHGLKNLANRVVDSITNDPALNGRKAKPIVLGTKDAFDKQMYHGKFAKKKVETGEVEPKGSVYLQFLIDEAKRGKTNDKLTRDVQDFIIKELDRHSDATHIILGCTELPLALGGHAKIHAFEKELNKDRDDDKKVHFLDTEAFFADQYTKLVAKNAGKTLSSVPETHEEEEEEEQEEEVEQDEITALDREKWTKYITILVNEQLGAGADKNAVEAFAADLCNHTVNKVIPAPDFGQALGLSDKDVMRMYEHAEMAMKFDAGRA